MNKDPIVDVIRHFRERKGVTQAALAKRTGMSPRTIQRIEAGETDMKLNQYRRVIDALEISDMDVSLALFTHEFVTAKDVAAVAKRLPFRVRRIVVKFLTELADVI